MRQSVPAGEILFDQGTIGRHFYVVLQGAIEAVLPSSQEEVHMRLHQPGDFTGELDMISGRPSLVRARTVDPTEVVEVDPVSLRNPVQTDPELSEFLLRVFIRRRVAMIPRATGDVVLIGSRNSADTLRLKEFLARTTGIRSRISNWAKTRRPSNCCGASILVLKTSRCS
jgi:thioredoxin reductase (NADPH)